MKKRLALLAVLMLLVGLLVAPTAFASSPVGGCPDDFNLRPFMNHGDHHHGGEHMHQHAGLLEDLNGDGYWCVKHVGANQQIHVHIDNNVPLP